MVFGCKEGKMTPKKFRADVCNAIAGAHDGMTTEEIVQAASSGFLRKILHNVDVAAEWDQMTLTTARSGSMRAAQCL